MNEMLEKLVSGGVVDERIAREAESLIQAVYGIRHEDGVFSAKVGTNEVVLCRRKFACTCEKLQAPFCEHILAAVLASGESELLKNLLAGSMYPGGWWGWRLVREGVVSENLVRNAWELVGKVKECDEAPDGSLLFEVENGDGIVVSVRIGSDRVACSRCKRFCRHILAVLFYIEKPSLFEALLAGKLEKEPYHQEEIVELSGRVVRVNPRTNGILLNDGEEEFWVNGAVEDVQAGDELVLRVKQRGKSRQVEEVLMHKKDGEPVGSPSVMQVGGTGGMVTGGFVKIDDEMREHMSRIVEVLDHLDEERMAQEVVIGAPPLLYIVDAWKCPRCGVLRTVQKCKKCGVKLDNHTYHPIKQLTWEGVAEAVRIQGNLHVKKAELRETVININGRKKTVVYGYAEVMDVARNNVFVGTSDEADPTRKYYTTILISKAVRNAFRKAISVEAINRVIKYAENVGLVMRADKTMLA